jgi:hypothetical protein
MHFSITSRETDLGLDSVQNDLVPKKSCILLVAFVNVVFVEKMSTLHTDGIIYSKNTYTYTFYPSH